MIQLITVIIIMIIVIIMIVIIVLIIAILTIITIIIIIIIIITNVMIVIMIITNFDNDKILDSQISRTHTINPKILSHLWLAISFGLLILLAIKGQHTHILIKHA